MRILTSELYSVRHDVPAWPRVAL